MIFLAQYFQGKKNDAMIKIPMLAQGPRVDNFFKLSFFSAYEMKKIPLGKIFKLVAPWDLNS
jgi:hypothetical protein